MLHQEIKNSVKKAMLAKDQVGLAVSRGLLAAFTNELVAKKRKPAEELADDEALAVIRREAKRREESIAQFESGGREDLVAAEKAELDVLKTYLPAGASREQIKAVVEKKKAELGLTDKSKAGQLIGAVIKELGGQADGQEVKAVVEEILDE